MCSFKCFSFTEIHLIISQPLWVLKTVNEKHTQRLIHMSADLARQISSTLEDLSAEDSTEVHLTF